MIKFEYILNQRTYSDELINSILFNRGLMVNSVSYKGNDYFLFDHEDFIISEYNSYYDRKHIEENIEDTGYKKFQIINDGFSLFLGSGSYQLLIKNNLDINIKNKSLYENIKFLNKNIELYLENVRYKNKYIMEDNNLCYMFLKNDWGKKISLDIYNIIYNFLITLIKESDLENEEIYNVVNDLLSNLVTFTEPNDIKHIHNSIKLAALNIYLRSKYRNKDNFTELLKYTNVKLKLLNSYHLDFMKEKCLEKVSLEKIIPEIIFLENLFKKEE